MKERMAVLLILLAGILIATPMRTANAEPAPVHKLHDDVQAFDGLFVPAHGSHEDCVNGHYHTRSTGARRRDKCTADASRAEAMKECSLLCEAYRLELVKKSTVKHPCPDAAGCYGAKQECIGLCLSRRLGN